jgi:pyruvate/2-oxoglutarate dehydrogenase complex dihydrolipoamide dehydrogenase (E3) component
MGDSFEVRCFLDEFKPKSAIIGAGYVGLEMADALTHRGIQVTLASRTERVLATVDPVYGAMVEAELQRHGVEVWNRTEAESIVAAGDQLEVTWSRWVFNRIASSALLQDYRRVQEVPCASTARWKRICRTSMPRETVSKRGIES